MVATAFLMDAYVQQPTRYLVANCPLYDPAMGAAGGVMCIYSGYVRRHVWKGREADLLMDGRGKAVMPCGDVYEGDCKMGMFEGLGVMRYANGDLYDGQWESHLRHGYGVIEYADGRSYSGLFRKGEKSGAGNDVGAVDSYSGSYRDGMANGPGRLVSSETGETIDGIFKNGRLEGLCTITYPNGDYYAGLFRNGLPHGKGRYVLGDSGDEFLETFENGHCVLGVLGPDENPVLATASPSTCLRRLTEQTADVHPSSAVDMTEKPATVSADRPRRCHIRYKKTGDEYIGDWRRAALGTGNRRGVRHGHGSLVVSSTGAVYVGSFLEDAMEGNGVMTFPKQFDDCPTSGPQMLEYRGEFHNNLFHGKAAVIYADGVTAEQFFCKGVAHGISHEQAPECGRQFKNEFVSKLYGPDEVVEGRSVDYHLRPGKSE